MKRALHASIVLAAVLPWAVAMMLLALALLLVRAAHRVWPDADHGNCWSFAGPRWHAEGGYLLVRMAEDVRIAGVRVIPHCIWLRSLPAGADIEQTVPLKRARSAWAFLHTPYFRFRVSRLERTRKET